MSRYSIALKKVPEKKSQADVVQFGIEEEIKGQRAHRAFRLMDGERARVRILYKDPKAIFFGSKCHWCGTTGFFCKSTPQKLAECCTANYQGKKPVFRIATIVRIIARRSSVDNFINQTNVEVLPWTFGKIMYERLNDMNKVYPITETDIMLIKGSNPYNVYDLMPCQGRAETGFDERAQEIADNLAINIRKHLAQDLDEPTIHSLLTSRSEALSSNFDQSYGSRLTLREVNVRDVAEQTRSRRRPRAIEQAARINLDDILGVDD